jgi:hypothetical protein
MRFDLNDWNFDMPDAFDFGAVTEIDREVVIDVDRSVEIDRFLVFEAPEGGGSGEAQVSISREVEPDSASISVSASASGSGSSSVSSSASAGVEPDGRAFTSGQVDISGFETFFF